MNTDDMTVAQLREVNSLLSTKKAPAAPLPFAVGDAIFIRTVTLYYVGRVRTIGRDFITLDEASWVADSGRYSDALVSGVFSEVEPMPSWAMIGRGTIIDVVPWSHAIPRVKK